MTVTRGLLIACGEDAVRDGLAALEMSTFGQHQPDRILLPGGCWWLAEAAAAAQSRLKRAAMNRSSAVEAVRELLRATTGPIVLAGHQDCSWYRARHPTLSAGDLVKRIGADMYAARDEAQRLAGRPLRIQGLFLVRASDGWEPRVLF